MGSRKNKSRLGTSILEALENRRLYAAANVPTALDATKVKEDSLVLKWTDTSKKELGFQIFRSGNNGKTWTKIGENNANDNTFDVKGLNEGKKYLFKVRAELAGDKFSEYSSNLSTFTAPSAPTDTSAENEKSTAIDISWTGSSKNETGYRIERSTDGKKFKAIGTADAEDTSYRDNSSKAGIKYWYRVVALGNGGRESISSNLATITVLKAPTNLTATAASATRINLSWSAVTGATSYLLQRSINGNDWNDIKELSKTSFADTNRSGGTRYFYRVMAQNGDTSSAFSSSAKATTRPAAPDNVEIYNEFEGELSLTWDTVKGDSGGYVIERSTDGDQWEEIGEADSGFGAYDDMGLDEFTQYTYRVRAVGSSGMSAASDEVQETTVLNAPTDLDYQMIDGTTINLSWSDNSSTEDGYIIEVSTDDGETWEEAMMVDPDVTETELQGEPNVTYNLRVHAFKWNNEDHVQSADSDVVTVTPEGGSLDLQVADDVAGFSLSWNSFDGATGYVLERSDGDEDVNFQQIAVLESDVTVYFDTEITEGTFYRYRVAALTGDDQSEWSETEIGAPQLFAPTNVTAEALGASTALISWEDNAQNETGYIITIFYGEGDVSSTTAGANGTSALVEGLWPGNHYEFFVTAVNDETGAMSADSETVMLDAPDVAIMWDWYQTDEGNFFSWMDENYDGAYVVERSTDGQNYDELTTTEAKEFTDTNGPEGQRCYYRVRRLGAEMASDPIDIVNPPAAPTDVTADVVDGNIVLNWTDNSQHENSYEIFFIDNNGDLQYITTVDADQTTAQVSTDWNYEPLVAGTTYTLFVRPVAPGQFVASEYVSIEFPEVA